MKNSPFDNKGTDLDRDSIKLLAEQNFLPMLVIQDGIVRYANHSFYELIESRTFTNNIPLEELLSNIRHVHMKDILYEYRFDKKTRNDIYTWAPFQIYTSSGKARWVELYGRTIEYSGENAEFITFLDITEKKNYEKEIKFLAFHDKLTQLYNRAFFEEEIKRMDVDRYLPISVIIGDLNGLKLTNDVFGHFSGDELLIKMAGILKSVCRQEDVIARWGGDEFAILLPSTAESTAREICSRIKSQCDDSSDTPIKISISLGFASKVNSEQLLKDIMILAEDMMYRQKLLESRSTRNAIISSLRETLFNRGLELESHTQRIMQLSQKFGKHIGLSEKELDELSLLSILHDIGKIAVPYNVLLKSDSLTSEEWDKVKTHPEKGYKIAVSNQELAHISEGILCHHERWDGKGYPQGLSGRDIPRLARIFSILDTFDVMTHKSVYKVAVSHHEALEEIKYCSGKQFEPELAELFIGYMEEIPRAD